MRVYTIAIGMLMPEPKEVEVPLSGQHYRSLSSAWAALRAVHEAAFDQANREVQQAIAIMGRISAVLAQVESGCRDYSSSQGIPPVLRIPPNAQPIGRISGKSPASRQNPITERPFSREERNDTEPSLLAPASDKTHTRTMSRPQLRAELNKLRNDDTES